MNKDYLPEFEFDLDLQDAQHEHDELDELDEKVVETDIDADDDTPEDVEQDDNAVAAYNYYKDNGLLTVEHEFDGTFDSLMEGLSMQLETYQQSVLESIVLNSPEFARPLVELILTKGNNFTLDEMTEILTYTRPSEYTQESLKDNDTAKTYLKEYFKNEGFDDDEIEDKIDFIEDRGLLSKEALTAFKKDEKFKKEFINSKVEQAKTEAENERQREQQLVQAFTDQVKSTKWKADKQKQVYEEFVSGRFKEKVETMLSKPETLVALVDLVSYFDGEKFDYNALKKQFSDAKETKAKIENYWQGGKMTSSQPAGKRNKEEDLTNFELIFD